MLGNLSIGNYSLQKTETYEACLSQKPISVSLPNLEYNKYYKYM